MSASLELVATGGSLVYVGLTRDPIRIDDSLFHRREITLLASRNSCNQFPAIIRQIENGRIDTSPWITHRLSLTDVVAQFQDLPEQQTLIKAMIDVRNGHELDE
jgi:threonine dehydrogenase-like Zn-dependent dehydrogenase